MAEAPSLLSLCLNLIVDELLRGGCDDEFLATLYKIPPELFDSMLPRLTPLALENLHRNMPSHECSINGPQDENSGSQRKRKRWLNFEGAWKKLYEVRWGDCGAQIHSISWLAKQFEAKHELRDDWQQMYWERHLQNCLDAAAEIAMIPSFSDGIGVIKIPATIVRCIGYWEHMNSSACDYSKFSDHCQHFGLYARRLRLPSALCLPEICDLLRTSNLETLEIHWIKLKDHVDGICELLKQNSETLKSIEFVHCKLSTSFIDAICDSLWIKGLKTHGIEHFSIRISNFLDTSSSTLPAGLASFLSSGRCLSSLSLSDDHLRRNFVEMILDVLFDSSSNIAALDLSENYMSGWPSHFKWTSRPGKQLSSGIGKSLQSLRVLNLRNNNLQRDDVDFLKYALVCMPKLESLDLSDNPIEDDGIKNMMPYFVEMSEKPFSLIDLKLGQCELTFNSVSQLLNVLSRWKKPLTSLCIGENNLGSKIGALLGKFLSKGLQSLDIDDINLGPPGFQKAQDEIMGDLKLVYINISKNYGGIETANFLSKLISCAPELTAIDARCNSMPVESLSIICSTLKAMRGKVEHLDLRGNTSLVRFADASLLDELKMNRKSILKLDSSYDPDGPYDQDP
ncbi:NACHT, LRR and PYD domains-containing protein 5-like isoform X2 [Coffea eugenioides]|uniref:NACHT, LRR and PYD domains-containing protein 5-like isoform X2 n=1 Tax=Coffea eugenioides TaxID=49369 RepID=UPI000F60A5CC|nr:NACHT, LRR and PYD domains-containing protein 5-like isoform X2 [Coffea eugenioides]